MYNEKETLWSYTLQLNPQSWTAQNNFGINLFELGRVPEAAEHFEIATRLNPYFVEAHNNLGFTLECRGRISEAKEQYEIALRLNPRYVRAQTNLARLLQNGQKTVP